MKKLLFPILAALTFMIAFTSCDKDDMDANLTLNINGLEDLGSDYAYEGWIMVDGSPKTTGTFTVDGNGELSKTSFSLDKDDLDKATAFILTIEPSPDSSPDPSHVHILAGDFTDNAASLTIDHSAALNNDFSSSAGKYILATPTNGSESNEKSGIWFLDITSGSPMTGLTLPTLPTGWAYEGWVVIDGTPVTTGTFTSVSGADDSALFSGTMDGPPFPGEDFLNNAPSGLTFPTDISGGKAVISIEPVPDNDAHPFLLKPLVSDIPIDAADHAVYDMGKNLSFPMGTASK